MENLKVGLQLYSVRDKLEKDMEGTLKAVKEMGYDYVELAGYYGKTAEEIKALLDKTGLKCIATHYVYSAFPDFSEKHVEFIKTLGAKFCVISWMGIDNHKGSPSFENTVECICRVGRLLRDNGIALLYHNHEFEFEKYDDKYLFDWLYDTVGLDILKPEIDTCWVKYAGEDPCGYLGKYAEHIDIVHLKDFVCDKLNSTDSDAPKKSREENDLKFTSLGSGMQNIEELLTAIKKTNAEYVVVEQDLWYDGDSLEYAKRSRDCLRSFGV